MRQILVDYARAHQATKRGGSKIKVPLDEVRGGERPCDRSEAAVRSRHVQLRCDRRWPAIPREHPCGRIKTLTDHTRPQLDDHVEEVSGWRSRPLSPLVS